MMTKKVEFILKVSIFVLFLFLNTRSDTRAVTAHVRAGDQYLCTHKTGGGGLADISGVQIANHHALKLGASSLTFHSPGCPS